MNWLGFGGLVASLLPLPLLGQAFPPAKGEIDLGLGYQYLSVRDHAYSNGETLDRGHTRNLGVIPDVTIGLTESASLRVALPLVFGKYVGCCPHPNKEDDGTWHAGFSDFNATFRYNLTKAPLFLTPEFTAIIPSHDYVTYAHSAIGRDLREFRVGMSAGRRLDPFLPKAVFQTRYYYSFVEQILNIPHNLSGGDWEFDYFLTPRLTAIGLGTWQYTHGGIEFPYVYATDSLKVFTPEQLSHHDQIQATRYNQVGGGLAFAMNNSVTLYGSAYTSVFYENGHRTFLGLSMGAYYTFRPGGREKPSSAIPESVKDRRASR